jgi:hypothetical protein
MSYCEDYPCCGHTPAAPCSREWYDEPGAFDTSRPGNEHALCDHANGDCDADFDFDDDDYCADCGEEPHPGIECDNYDYANEGREDIHLDGMWEE